MTKQVFTIGDQVLRGEAKPVTHFDLRLRLLLRDMADTMYKENGIGLAAPQIGIKRRMIVIDLYDDEGIREFVNPEIIAEEGSVGMVEGCLSVPGRQGYVVRPEKVTVRAKNRKGEFFTVKADGLLARCLQHEIDHLNGVLYVDKMEYEVFEKEENRG